MGSIGGLMGLGGGSGGTGFNASSSGTNPQQLQQALTNAQQAVGNQQQVYGQLQNVAAGQGPNPAQAMLNQATGQNVQNQAALQAGQRGAAQNVGLAARNAGLQGANIQQQAAGQGASMQATQALNALNSAGGVASGITSAQQNEQNILQGANTASQNIQGQLANTNLQGQQALIGGVMQGIGSGASMLAKGGQVQRFDDGGSVDPSLTDDSSPGAVVSDPSPQMQVQTGPSQDPADQALAQANQASKANPMQPQSQFGQALNNQAQGQMPAYANSNPGSQALQAGAKAMMSGSGGSSGGGGGGAGGLMSLMALMNKGGDVGDKLKGGGHVPGEPKIKGNSYKNDTVKALLSPGEVVIPNSVMQSKDPARGAAQFVQAVMAKKRKKA
jgi:hypothetical protein